MFDFSLKLDKEQLIKLFKSALIAGAGVGATYFLEGALKLDFGALTPVIVGILTWLINTVKVCLKK